MQMSLITFTSHIANFKVTQGHIYKKNNKEIALELDYFAVVVFIIPFSNLYILNIRKRT